MVCLGIVHRFWKWENKRDLYPFTAVGPGELGNIVRVWVNTEQPMPDSRGKNYVKIRAMLTHIVFRVNLRETVTYHFLDSVAVDLLKKPSATYVAA